MSMSEVTCKSCKQSIFYDMWDGKPSCCPYCGSNPGAIGPGGDGSISSLIMGIIKLGLIFIAVMLTIDVLTWIWHGIEYVGHVIWMVLSWPFRLFQ
jgi:hypothetical protein